MSDNPYAPPQSAFAPTAPPQSPHSPQDWEYNELLTQAWQALVRDWPVILGTGIVSIVIRAVTSWILQTVMGGGLAATTARNAELQRAIQSNADLSRVVGLFGPQMGIAYGSGIVNELLTAFLSVGLTRVMIASIRGEGPQFSVLFSGFSRHFPYVGAYLIFVSAMFVGTALCVVPGAVVWSMLFPMLYFVSDTELGPIESVSAAARATEGQRMKIFGFSILMLLLAMGGILACCVGALVTYPLAGMAFSALYVRLSGRPTSEWAAGGTMLAPPPGVGGGYG